MPWRRSTGAAPRDDLRLSTACVHVEACARVRDCAGRARLRRRRALAHLRADTPSGTCTYRHTRSSARASTLALFKAERPSPRSARLRPYAVAARPPLRLSSIMAPTNLAKLLDANANAATPMVRGCSHAHHCRDAMPHSPLHVSVLKPLPPRVCAYTPACSGITRLHAAPAALSPAGTHNPLPRLLARRPAPTSLHLVDYTFTPLPRPLPSAPNASHFGC
eukprot:4328178-Pleurochrysis_carterae.AAC.8